MCSCKIDIKDTYKFLYDTIDFILTNGEFHDKIEKNSRIYSHLDITQINHSLTFDGNNYHFINNDMNCLYQTLNIEELIKSEQKNLIKKSKNV